VFQLPLIIFVLGWFGVISSQGLREKRRVAIVLSFVMSMFLTPPDPMSQMFMAIPLCLLYELSIWAVWIKEKSLRSANP
jgi:sec-independent protein translocase protein TatC